MEKHVRIAAWLRIVWSVLWVLLAVAAFWFFSAMVRELLPGMQNHYDRDSTVDSVVAMLPRALMSMPLTVAVLALPGLVTGWGLLTYRSWAPMVNVILSAFDLLLVPIGTIFGGYSIWVMLHPETVELFKAGGPEGRYPAHL